jgi:hypothetical protein
MKKYLLIILAALAFSGYSQGVDHNFKNLTSIPAYTMDGDTSYTFKTTNQYFFDFQFVWASLDQTDGSVKIEISEDGTNYVDYPNMDTLLLSSATGSGIIRDTFKGTASRYLKISVDSGTCSSGTLTIYGNLATKP